MARVLIAEDDLQILAQTEANLRRAGHEPIPAIDVPEAFDLLASDADIDLLFADIALKDNLSGGLHVANEARRRRPQLPVVYTTAGEVDDEIRGRMVEGGRVLLKPYLPTALTGLIAEMVRH
ncbi:MAG: response regulator [Bauldia sp.]